MTPAVTPNWGGPTERGGPKPGWAYRTGWPKAGVGLPNGLRRIKFRSSEILCVRIFDKAAGKYKENTCASKRFFEESFCRKCSWGAYATLHRRISHYLSRGPVFFLESPIFLLILCADFELRSRMCFDLVL